MNVVLFGADLMDRSKITAALGDVGRGRTPADAAGAGVVIVDLTRFAELVPAIRDVAPEARIVAYGPHVEGAAQAAAHAAGADRVLPRSRFFRDPAQAVAP